MGQSSVIKVKLLMFKFRFRNETEKAVVEQSGEEVSSASCSTGTKKENMAKHFMKEPAAHPPDRLA